MKYRIRVNIYNDGSKKYLPECYCGFLYGWCSISFKYMTRRVSSNIWLNSQEETDKLIDEHWKRQIKSTKILKVNK